MSVRYRAVTMFGVKTTVDIMIKCFTSDFYYVMEERDIEVYVNPYDNNRNKDAFCGIVLSEIDIDGAEVNAKCTYHSTDFSYELGWMKEDMCELFDVLPGTPIGIYTFLHVC